MTNDFFKNKGISQCYISPYLGPLATEFGKKFNLSSYSSNNLSTVFFGIYSREDFFALKKHTGQMYIIFEGHDIELVTQNNLLNYIKNISNLKEIFSVTREIEKNLNNSGISNVYTNLNFVDGNIFNKKENMTGNKVYVYNGFVKEGDKLYKKEIYDSIVKKLSKYELIFSNMIRTNYENLSNVYSQCFIGLSIVDDENPIREMQSMGIPVINNTEDNCLRWNSIDDIIDTIDQHYIEKFGNNIPDIKFTVNNNNEELKINNEELKIDNEELNNAINNSIDRITENVLNEITQKITESVIVNVSNKLNATNYRELLFENIDTELNKIRLQN
jgi:hypothetical protein